MSELLTTENVRGAATMAGLPLADHDLTAVRDLLNQWLPAAIELSTRMQAVEVESLTPITTFTVSSAADAVALAEEGDLFGHP